MIEMGEEKREEVEVWGGDIKLVVFVGRVGKMENRHLGLRDG